MEMQRAEGLLNSHSLKANVKVLPRACPPSSKALPSASITAIFRVAGICVVPVDSSRTGVLVPLDKNAALQTSFTKIGDIGRHILMFSSFQTLVMS